jgi:uncharacterized repeat protein (TIGR03837 family)
LLAARNAFRSNAAARAAMWQRIGVAPATGGLTVSLFSYANPALPALLDTWAEGDESILCIVPEGVARSELDAWAGGAVPHLGTPLVCGRLTIVVAPFVDQDDFDRRLWACDVNFVRGEDSFVRAQWAGQPFIWQIYPQAEDVHLLKFDAFLMRFEAGLAAAPAQAQRAFWYAWNAGDPDGAASAWFAYRAALPVLAAHGQGWSRALGRTTDLATALVRFCENRL